MATNHIGVPHWSRTSPPMRPYESPTGAWSTWVAILRAIRNRARPSIEPMFAAGVPERLPRAAPIVGSTWSYAAFRWLATASQ